MPSLNSPIYRWRYPSYPRPELPAWIPLGLTDQYRIPMNHRMGGISGLIIQPMDPHVVHVEQQMG